MRMKTPWAQEGTDFMEGDQAANAASDVVVTAKPESPKRERSSIEFPYGDLDDAIKLSKAVHEVGGQSCTLDQLAAHQKQSANSGAFRLRTSYPRIFGLAETERGSIRLTDLGMRVVDPSQEERARIEAFLFVPLYKAIYEKYKGYTLPPAVALEREMANLGVSSKQTDKARQVFDRSARQAGFYWSGGDRLVIPAIKGEAPNSRPLDAGTPGAASASFPAGNAHREAGGGGGGSGTGDLLLDALIAKLPPPGQSWSIDDRITWLSMMAMGFQMAYGPEGNIDVKRAQ